MKHLIAILLLLAGQVQAEIYVAARTMRAQEVLMPEDIVLANINTTGGTNDAEELLGQELRRAIYAGHPIRPQDVRAPALVERNQIVPLLYRSGGLLITTDGRALDRAAAGEWTRIMNLSSRTTVSAQITPDGSAVVR